MDVYFNARPIGLFKLVVIHCQLGFTSTRTSLNRSFGRPCSYDLNTSKYTNMYRPFGQNLAVWTTYITVILTVQMGKDPMDLPYYINLTVQMDDCPLTRLYYVNLDGPN